MQDEYDRIKIADLMEEKFQKYAGLSILIELYQDIPELGDLVDTLRKEMAEGNVGAPLMCTPSLPSPALLDPCIENKSRSKAKNTAIGPTQNESSTSHFVFNTEEDLELGSTMATPSSEKPEDALTKSLDIVTTQSFQEEYKLPELSTANRCPAMSEPQTPQGLPTTACSSLQTPLEPPEISHSILTTSQGPSAPFSTSDQTSQVSPVTASSSIHTSQASRVTPTTVPSSVQAFLVTPATTTSGYNSPLVSAARVSGSYNTPQFTPTARASNFNPPPQSPASRPSNFSMQQASLATVSRSFSAALVSPATPFKVMMGCSHNMMTEISTKNFSWSLMITSDFAYIFSLYLGKIFLKVRLNCSWLFCVHFMQKPRLKTVPKQSSQEDGYHQGPKEVVLKATELFIYDMRENKMMFHATVATETEFFRVKVFDKVLKEKFIPKKVTVISDYIGHNGFLEIHRASSVSEVNGTNIMNIPVSLRQRANATPKINTICSQIVGTFVNGVFAVYVKKVKGEFIYYGIEDNTGKMEVVVHGQFTNMYCEPGDKLRLFCFESSSCVDTWQLSSCVDMWQLSSCVDTWQLRSGVDTWQLSSCVDTWQLRSGRHSSL
ncbi:hypothetical protein U0070_004776, partial [Myodes glareolus]